MRSHCCYPHRKGKTPDGSVCLRWGVGVSSKGISQSKRILTHLRKSFTSASLGGDVEVVLGGAALVLAFPKEQDLAWISAGGAAAL